MDQAQQVRGQELADADLPADALTPPVCQPPAIAAEDVPQVFMHVLAVCADMQMRANLMAPPKNSERTTNR